MENNTKQERLVAIFAQLRLEGRIATKKDFAQLLGVNYHGLIDAMNGSPKALTESLVAKAAALVSDPPLAPPVQPPVTMSGETLHNMTETMRRQEENISRLISLLEQQAGGKSAQSSAS